MSSRSRRVDVEIDELGVLAAFLFGGAVGLSLVYPTFPAGARLFEVISLQIQVGPVGGPLLFGTLMFLGFFLGVFGLNFFYIERDT